jgi:AAA+ superfamily predicted ATPase
VVTTVAEEMHVPLYSITAGQLQADPGAVQRQLQDAFKIAVTWKAIILLDEADIFLERRSYHDLERNRLVSGMFYSGLFVAGRKHLRDT